MVELADNPSSPRTLGTDDIKRKFRQAASAVDVQDMLCRVTSQCFRKCVPRPQEALNSSEQHCIALCADRYVDSYNLVARAFVKRLQRELRRGLELKKARDKGQEKPGAGGTAGSTAMKPAGAGARVLKS